MISPPDRKNLIYNSILLFFVASLYLKFEVFYLILRRFLSFIVFLKENIGKLSVQAHSRTAIAPAQLHKLNFTFLPEDLRPPGEVLFEVKTKTKRKNTVLLEVS